MQRSSVKDKHVPLIEAKDYGSVGIDSDSVNMSLLRRICAAFLFGAVTGNSILKIYAGATAGAKTTALAFNFRTTGGDFKAANADVLGAETAVASTGLTLTAATYDHREITIDVESIDMPSGKPWLTFEIDATASVMNVACLGIGSPVYGGESSPTTI